MKRSLALITLLVLFVAPLLWAADAWAQAGRRGSSGSRGSRTYSAPARPSPVPAQPGQPASPLTQQPAPQRPGWGGMLGGLLVGGLIGSLLFGGLGGGAFGGVGLMEMLLLGALVYFAFSFMRRRQAAAPPGYASPGGGGAAGWPSGASYSGTATAEAPAPPSEVERGIGHIRQMDPSFDAARFARTASDIFSRVQAAWTARDMGPVGPALTEEMRGILQRDCDQLRAERRINRLENIAVRSAEVTEAWQERGQDFVTVRFLAGLLSYTTDESGAQVVEGSRTQPVTLEEYWTFTRPVGPNPWRLSAIQQPA